LGGNQKRDHRQEDDGGQPERGNPHTSMLGAR
jgi:hypothetical protein